MALEDGFFIASGHVSRSQMQVNGYEIKGLPIQTDQIGGRQWIRPGNTADVVKPATLVDSISGKRFSYGGQVFKWPMVNLSPKMVYFLHDTFFSLNWHAELTVQTFNRATGEYEAYQVDAKWPDYATEAEPSAGGYNNFVLTFINGVIAPEGPEVSLTGSADGNFVAGSYGTYSVTVANTGDDDTFSNIQVDTELSSSFIFTNEVSLGWTFFWSQNGSDYYSYLSNPPGSLLQVRYGRWITSNTVNANSTSLPIDLTFNLTLSGTFSQTFTVTMDGDVDDTNNSITFIAEIPNSPYTSGFSSGFGVSDSAFSSGFDTNAFGITTEQGFGDGFSNGFGANPS